MADIRKLRGVFCYKILPLVYDDSLSYYEVLCKLVAKMNEMIEDYNDNIESWFDAYMEGVELTTDQPIATYDADTETLDIAENVTFTVSRVEDEDE